MFFAFTKRIVLKAINGPHSQHSAPYVMHFHVSNSSKIMGSSLPTYAEALSLLDKLHTNRAVVKMIQQSDNDMNINAIPEMLVWIYRAGYCIEDFNRLNVIHVAGTKGKGSVCAMAESILREHSKKSVIRQTRFNNSLRKDCGYEYNANVIGKIGLYTSPHLLTVRERIRINGKPISESLFTEYFFSLWERFSSAAAAAGHSYPTSPDTKPGFFRYLTIMALHTFLQEGVRTAIVECGIGGEYDSTNILRKEAVAITAITKLGIDHVGILGDTIQKISWHKSGIMKQGIKCLTVHQEPEAMEVLIKRANQNGAFLSVAEKWEEIESGKAQIHLEGNFQRENASLAVGIVREYLKQLGLGDRFEDGKLSPEARDGLKDVKLSGRCEVRYENNILWCIDGAHTMDSIKLTAEWFASKLQCTPMGQAMLIFNQQDRDAIALLRALHLTLKQATRAKHIFSNAIFCLNTPFKPKNRVPFEPADTAENLSVQKLLADVLSDLDSDTEIEIYPFIEEAVEKARKISKDHEKLLVLVTGSLHLVGGFLKVQNSSAIV